MVAGDLVMATVLVWPGLDGLGAGSPQGMPKLAAALILLLVEGVMIPLCRSGSLLSSSWHLGRRALKSCV